MLPAAKSENGVRKLLHAATHPFVSCCLLVLMLVPLLLAGQYNWPSNDDYYNSVWTDFLAYQKWLYLQSTGRFFSSLIIAIDPIRWHSFLGYRLAADGLIIAFALTFTHTICRLLGRFTAQPFRIRFFLGVAATFIIFNGTISLAEGFYWFTGSMTYTLPLLFVCWAAMLGLRMDACPDRRQIFPAVLQALLVAASTACNEVIIGALGVLVFALSVYYRQVGRRQLSNWYRVLLALWAVTAAFELLAPGNTVRQSGVTRNFFISMPSWLYFSKELFLEWILEPIFLAFSLAYLAIASRHQSKLRIKPLPAFLISLALVLIVIFPGYWALANMPPRRVRHLCYVLFLPAWMAVLTTLAAEIYMLRNTRPQVWQYLRSPLAIAAVLILLIQFRIETLRGSSNYMLLAKDFRKKILVNYDAEHRARYNLLRYSKQDTLILPRLQYKQSNMVHFADLGPDPEQFPNTSVAQYFGKKLVILAPDTTKK